MASEQSQRDESPAEQMDRNWDELLQELRVTQTGVQILTGFLLTLPFQQRFPQLTSFEHDVYLITVVLAGTATALIIAPVGFHRLLFRDQKKDLLVLWGNRLAKSGLVFLGLTVSSVSLLIFHVVEGALAGALGAILAALLYGTLWLALPTYVGRQRDNNVAKSKEG
jgi:energy-converting hydrogenase Eha subunit A